MIFPCAIFPYWLRSLFSARHFHSAFFFLPQWRAEFKWLVTCSNIHSAADISWLRGYFTFFFFFPQHNRNASAPRYKWQYGRQHNLAAQQSNVEISSMLSVLKELISCRYSCIRKGGHFQALNYQYIAHVGSLVKHTL